MKPIERTDAGSGSTALPGCNARGVAWAGDPLVAHVRRAKARLVRIARVLPLAAGALAAACETPETPAGPIAEPGYDFTLGVAEPVVYRWPVGATVRVFVAGGDSSARGRVLAGALAAAAADWESALGPGGVRLVATARADRADIVLRWSDAAAPIDTVGCAPVVTGRAATTFCRTPDGFELRPFPLEPPFDAGAGAVKMVVTVLAGEAGDPERVRQLVAHELGHVLGIGRHSPDPDDLMWGGGLTALRPSTADRATIRTLYRRDPDIAL